MRIRPFCLAALCLLAPLMSATGAPVSIRNQVEALLATVIPKDDQPEVATAQREAKAALARAEQTRTSAPKEALDAVPVIEQTALEWAQLSKELGDLDELQSKADAAEKQLDELEAQLKREKAHLEETEARRGRALATLERLGFKAQVSGSEASSATIEEPKP